MHTTGSTQKHGFLELASAVRNKAAMIEVELIQLKKEQRTERLADKVARGRDHGWVDFAFFLGATGENASRLGALEYNEGCAGVKVFMGSSTGSLLVWQDEVLEEVLANGRRRVAVHCEDEQRLRDRKHLAVDHPRNHPIWRDEQTALLATQRLVRLARKTGRPVHVLHVTTAEEAEFLRHQKDVATMEVTPSTSPSPTRCMSAWAPSGR